MQPFSLNDNLFCICNGEIYNYKELAHENNYNLETDSDCEIILHLYSNNSVNSFINKLDGVFSFILLDSIKNEIIIGHDPFGIRPLYYCFSPDYTNVSFASEMKCLTENNNNVQFDISDLENVLGKTIEYLKIKF